MALAHILYCSLILTIFIYTLPDCPPFLRKVIACDSVHSFMSVLLPYLLTLFYYTPHVDSKVLLLQN